MPSPSLEVRRASSADLKKPVGEGRLYAILDACNSRAIQTKVRELGKSEAPCLYRGRPEPEILEIAPYLVRVTPELLDWIGKAVWKTPWGIFAIADADFRTLRQHFRKFLLVQGPAGEILSFRYYDPRTLQAFLPVCDEDELKVFFGPVLAYVASRTESTDVQYFFRAHPPPEAEKAPPPPGEIYLRLRSEHMEVFAATASRSLEERFVPSIRRRFAKPWKQMGEEILRARIRHGIGRAGGHGFELERDVFRYVCLALALGDDFDRSVETPWAGKILNRRDLTPDRKLTVLYEAARTEGQLIEKLAAAREG